MVLGFMRNERPRNCAAVKPAIAWLLQVVHAGPRSAVVHIVACLFQYIRRHSAAGTTAAAGDHRLVLGDLLQLALQPIQRDVDRAWHMAASVFISGADIHDRGAFFDLLVYSNSVPSAKFRSILFDLKMFMSENWIHYAASL